MSRDKEEQQAYDELSISRAEIESPCEVVHYRALRRIANNANNHLALGFGGGSVPALAANVALASIFEELGLRDSVKEVWGTSAGSIVAGAFSSGIPASKILKTLIELDRPGVVDIPKWEIFGRGFIKLLRKGKLPEGFVRGNRFRQAIVDSQPVSTIEECEIPLRVITCTDDGNARKVVLRKGPLADAGMASMCIPGVMLPIQDWNGASYGYMDGAVVEKTPLISIIEEHGRVGRSEQLVVVATHYGPRMRKPEGFLQRWLSTIDHMEEVVWEYQRSQAREAPNCKFAILNPQLRYGGLFDFSYILFNYLWARKAFKDQLSNAGLAMRFDAR